MGQIFFQFEGICVNFQRSANPLLPVEHRVVLVNASTLTSIFGVAVRPHVALYRITIEGTNQPLNGASLSVANAIGFGCYYGPAYQSIPVLTRIAPTLGPPSLPIITGENPLLAAAYVDFNTGAFGCCISEPQPGVGGAAYTTVTVTTEGDPRLRIARFPTTIGPPPPPEIITVPDGATIFVMNECPDAAPDTTSDFLINYTTAATLPVTAPPIPPEVQGIACAQVATTPWLGDTIDVGCSNSAYP